MDGRGMQNTQKLPFVEDDSVLFYCIESDFELENTVVPFFQLEYSERVHM